MWTDIRIWLAIFRQTFIEWRYTRRVNEAETRWQVWRWLWHHNAGLVFVAPDGTIRFLPF